MTLGKPLPSSGVSGSTKLSVSSMLSEDPSLPVEHAPVDGGLSGDEWTGGLWLWLCRFWTITIEWGRWWKAEAEGIVRGGGIPPLLR